MCTRGSAVVACGANQYLRLEGGAPTLHKLLAHLEEDLGTDAQRPAQVIPESQNNPAIKSLVGLGIRSTTGPVSVKIEADVAWLVGGRRELTRLLEQMKGMVDRGPEHFEILRVFDEGYEYIDGSTYIDLVVT